MTLPISRREVLAGAAALGLTGNAGAAQKAPRDPFIYMFNTSTIQGQNLPITAEVDIAAKAGYQAIEPWIRELDQHVKGGGNLKDLGKRIRDSGLTVPSAIGFAEWIVDDDTKRKKGMEEAKRDMDGLTELMVDLQNKLDRPIKEKEFASLKFVMDAQVPFTAACPSGLSGGTNY